MAQADSLNDPDNDMIEPDQSERPIQGEDNPLLAAEREAQEGAVADRIPGVPTDDWQAQALERGLEFGRGSPTSQSGDDGETDVDLGMHIEPDTPVDPDTIDD